MDAMANTNTRAAARQVRIERDPTSRSGARGSARAGVGSLWASKGHAVTNMIELPQTVAAPGFFTFRVPASWVQQTHPEVAAMVVADEVVAGFRPSVSVVIGPWDADLRALVDENVQTIELELGAVIERRPERSQSAEHCTCLGSSRGARMRAARSARFSA